VNVVRQPLSIFGAGSLGKELLAWLRTLPDWELIGFFDDNVKKGTVIKGIPVVGNADDMKALRSQTNVIVAIGDPKVKREVLVRLGSPAHIKYPALVHPAARLEDSGGIAVGAGSIITAGCILTSDIRVGSHVLINLACTIGHDTGIGDFSSIMPGASIAGQVSIGSGVLIGSGVVVNNGINIGDGSTVGAGAVVISNVAANTTVVGVPARPIERR
jgi:sugar O-acyltransferase (sialic acid O-acetyltransferase NeuD family)